VALIVEAAMGLKSEDPTAVVVLSRLPSTYH
jgi:hypothetical protein